jgi:hypothetical protein
MGMGKIVALLLLSSVVTSLLCVVSVKPVFASFPIEDSWTQMASMNQARAGLGVVSANGKIYAIGGTTASGQSPPDAYKGGFVVTNEVYDSATDTWTTKASMPTPRAHFAIATYQNKIYCIGGAVGFTVDERSGFHSYITSGVNEVYDIVTDSWDTKKSIPFHATKMLANVVNDKIYVMQEFFMYAYDPINDSWTNKTRIPATPRTWSGATPVSFVVDNKIIVTGEFQSGPLWSEQKVLPSGLEQRVLIYDTETDSWSEGKTGPTIVGGGAAGITTGINALQRAYVLGLVVGKFPPVLTNQAYDPKTDSWMSANAMPSLRSDFGVAVIEDVLYAIGGYCYTSQIYGMVAPVALNEKYIPLGYGVSPEVKVLSPLNQLYNDSSVPLVFTVDKPVNWLGYSLDGKENITISGNTTLTGLSNGSHNITVYAEESFGKIGTSETVTFTMSSQLLPTGLIVATSGVTIAIGVVSLVYYYKKRRQPAS